MKSGLRLTLINFMICSTFILTSNSSEYVPVQLSEQALKIHQEAIVIDGHNDLPGKLRNRLDSVNLRSSCPDFHTDIPRLIEGGVDAQFLIAYVPVSYYHQGGAAKYCLEQIELIHQMIELYPDIFQIAYTADDIKQIVREKKIASLIGVEGGHAIENSLKVLQSFYRQGARYMTLTHSDTIDWADSATDVSKHQGLTAFGEDVIQEMNRLGMLVDISHVSKETMLDVLAISQAPIIASHSSAYALSSCTRNVPDDVLVKIKRNRGIVMVNFYADFLTQEGAALVQQYFEYERELESDPTLTREEIQKLTREWDKKQVRSKTSVKRAVDHIEHIIKIAGIEHVGLGSDFDGFSYCPEQLEDVSKFPYITQELLNRGYAKDDIRKILGENFLRVFREVEEISDSLK